MKSARQGVPGLDTPCDAGVRAQTQSMVDA